jgi:hypothetical protein
VQFNKRLQPTAGRYDKQFGFFAARLPVGLAAMALENIPQFDEKKP